MIFTPSDHLALYFLSAMCKQHQASFLCDNLRLCYQLAVCMQQQAQRLQSNSGVSSSSAVCRGGCSGEQAACASWGSRH